MRKMFLEDFPRIGSGRGDRIKWSDSVGFITKFIYDDIEGKIEIIGYELKTQSLYIKYNDIIRKIKCYDFKKCHLASLLGKYTGEFRANIGQEFKDNKRDLVIVDRKDIKKNNETGKWYQYKCNKCDWDNGWVTERDFLRGYGCSCCYGRTVVPGINDIPTTAPWMVKFFQGGYDEAKLYTKTSSKKIKPVCPDCGRVKSSFVSISNMYANHSIHCPCSDGVSYPEKFMFYLLENLDIKFFMQPNKNVFKWSKGFRYDFYIPKLNCIIETHGEQHYIEKTAFAKKLKEQQEDDRLKEQLARDNGIKYYIVLDCRKSDLDWVKNSILNSELAKLFDLSKIDWLKFGEISYSNLIKKVCAIKKNNPNLTSTDISKLMKLSSVTILKYLKKGTKLGWCNYNPKEESAKAKEKSAKMAKERNSKIVEIFKDDKSLGIFDSGHELARQSEKLFGVKLDNKHISDVCLGRRCHHRGFTFKYV